MQCLTVAVTVSHQCRQVMGSRQNLCRAPPPTLLLLLLLLLAACCRRCRCHCSRRRAFHFTHAPFKYSNKGCRNTTASAAASASAHCPSAVMSCATPHPLLSGGMLPERLWWWGWAAAAGAQQCEVANSGICSGGCTTPPKRRFPIIPPPTFEFYSRLLGISYGSYSYYTTVLLSGAQAVSGYYEKYTGPNDFDCQFHV